MEDKTMIEALSKIRMFNTNTVNRIADVYNEKDFTLENIESLYKPYIELGNSRAGINYWDRSSSELSFNKNLILEVLSRVIMNDLSQSTQLQKIDGFVSNHIIEIWVELLNNKSLDSVSETIERNVLRDVLQYVGQRNNNAYILKTIEKQEEYLNRIED